MGIGTTLNLGGDEYGKSRGFDVGYDAEWRRHH